MAVRSSVPNSLYTLMKCFKKKILYGQFIKCLKKFGEKQGLQQVFI